MVTLLYQLQMVSAPVIEVVTTTVFPYVLKVQQQALFELVL